ncbi:MAG: hypothetical protein ACYDDF_00355 [Thermoplasmatota archaeon]
MAGAALGYALTWWQWLALFAVWIAFFALPAFAIRRHAAKCQNPVGHYWFWSTILLLGPLGPFVYWQDMKIRARKGEKYRGEP